MAAPSGTGRRLGHLLLAGAGRARDHGPVPLGPGRAGPRRPSCTPPRTRRRRCCIRPTRRRSTTIPRSWRTPTATASCAPSRTRRARPGLRRGRQMGELARRLEQPRSLYRGLRPEAYALALYLARLTRDAGGGSSPAHRHQHRARPRVPARCCAAATPRPPTTTRCTPPAGRSTSCAGTPADARRRRFSTRWTASRRST